MAWGVNDYPESPKEKPRYLCPICYEECSTLYLGLNKEVIGCENCVSEIDADEYYQENHY